MISLPKRFVVLTMFSFGIFAAMLSGEVAHAQTASTLGTAGTPSTAGTAGSPSTLGTGGSPSTLGTAGTPTSGTLENPLNAPDIPTLLNEILAYVRVIGGIFLTLMLVVTGVMFVLARGNPEKVGQARSALMWTAIGGLLLLGAQALASVIAATVQSL